MKPGAAVLPAALLAAFLWLPQTWACPALCILAEGQAVKVHEAGACAISGLYFVPSEPEGEDADASRVFRLLASTASLLERPGCEWTLAVPDRTFVNAEAVLRRLQCGFARLDSEPLVLARMAGRLALNFIYDRQGEAVRFGTLRGGVLMNRRAMEELQRGSEKLHDWQNFLRLGAESENLLRGRRESHSVDDVGFNRVDFIFTMYWWRHVQTGISPGNSVRVQNWGSYMEQYLIGPDVESRLDVRSRVVGMPCVLVAHPVENFNAEVFHRHTRTCSADPTCKIIDVAEMWYSWLKWDQTGWESESFIPERIKQVLDVCPSEADTRECATGEVVDYGTISLRNTTTYIDDIKSVVVLSPPGGGTSWMFHKVRENVRSPDKMVVDFDLFQPYCNDKLRVELSQIFSAGEDYTKFALVMEKIPSDKFSLLPVLFDLVSKGRTVVTKEVMNIFRILDLHEYDESHVILFLFRSRHHTFPSSEAVCRTCFFAAFHESFVVQNFSIPWLQEARNLLVAMHPDAMLTHVLIHTTLWRYVLYKLRLWGEARPRFLKYADMMRAEDPETAIHDAWNYDGRLESVIDFAGLGQSLKETRQTSEWLDQREHKYLALDLEHMVKGYLSILQGLDPETDVSILLSAN